jgi:arabinose-5-phosphate isomerase
MTPSKANAQPVVQDNAAGDLAAAHRVLSHASEALLTLSASLNGDFIRAVGLLLAARGRVIVSGMGKSGHVARKIAATLSSTGTPAYFVHPAEAAHGDMGAVTPDDVLLLLSWGGETAELSALLTYAKRYRITVIGMGAHGESTLMKAADVKLLVPQVPEACPMGMAPTTSTTLMMSLGDAIAVALMERKGFSPDQYRDFHPGGSLGRALIRVRDLMHQGNATPLCREDTPMGEALLVIASGRMGCVAVVDEGGGLVGIVTDGDVRRHYDGGFASRSAGQVMTRGPRTTGPDVLAAEALALMIERKITQLIVVDPADATRKPIGILHIHDCLRAGPG